MRSMSASAFDQTLKPAKWPLMFIGSAWRSETKPECISPQIGAGMRARRPIPGQKPFFGAISCRNSPMASVSQTRTPS